MSFAPAATADSGSGTATVLINTSGGQPARERMELAKTMPPESPPGGSPGDYEIQTWTTDRGLPQNTVQCLLQSSDGYLWVGTQNGLARYDGLHFTVFDRQNTPALKSDNILCLTEGPDHTLWIGTAGGLVRLRNHRFDGFSTRVLAPLGEAKPVWTVSVGVSGDLWAGAGPVLMTFRDESLSTITNFPQEVTSVLCDKSGQLWVGTSGGLYRRPSGETNWTALLRGAIVHALTQDHRGNVAFGSEGVLWQWQNGRLHAFRTKDGLSGGLVRRVAEDAQGALWAVVGGRLNRLQDGRSWVVGGEAGLVNDLIECVYPDREQNIWLGTSHSGLIRLRPRRVITYTTRDGLMDDDVTSICEGRNGDLWFASYHGVSLFADNQFLNFTNASAPVLEDRGRNVWFGWQGALAFRREGSQVINESIAAPWCDHMNTIYQDRSGAIWVTAARGLWCLTGSEHVLYTISGADRLPPGPSDLIGRTLVVHTNALRATPLGVLEDSRGELWVGSRGGGLHRLRDGRFSTMTTADGLTSDFVGPLRADADGTLWAGSDKGLNRIQGGHVTCRYTIKEGLAENIVGNLLEDDEGWFWTMGHRGLHRFRKQDLIELADGKRRVVRTLSYGAADGLLSAEANVGLFPNATRTGDGLLWFPTTRGVLVVEPHELDMHDLPPPIVLEQVLADEQIIFGDGAEGPDGDQIVNSMRQGQGKDPVLRLPPGRARLLEFRYTASTFAAPEQMRFRYKLEGYDLEWREAGARRSAIYNDIAPGAYRFRVLAVSAQGVESAAAAGVAFSLAPHFYQTPYFYAGSILGVFLTGVGLHRVRIGTLARRQAVEQQLALALQRERIAKDMHDDLGSSLTQIGLLSEQARRQAADSPQLAAYIEKIAAATRQTAQAAEQMVWVVSPLHDSLDSLATYLCQFAREYLEPTRIRCRLEVPEQFPEVTVPSDVRHHLVLFIKEAMNNVVKHAVAREMWLTIDYQRPILSVRIADDGCGFLVPDEETGGAGAIDGNGLVNLRNRAAAMGGKFELSSRPGNGTSLSVRIGLQS